MSMPRLARMFVRVIVQVFMVMLFVSMVVIGMFVQMQMIAHMPELLGEY
jgi:hypothetical protein